ncbi:MAG: GNAT family N-acetyltransferase [Sphingomonas sp.]
MASIAGAFGVERWRKRASAADHARRDVPAAPLPARVNDATLRALQPRLIPVAVALNEALAGRLPVLPPLGREAQGYAVGGLAVDRAHDLATQSGMIAIERRHHIRTYADLSGRFDRYVAMLPPRVRDALTQHGERIAALSGGVVPVTRCGAPGDVDSLIDQVHRIARRAPHHRLPGALAIDAASEARLATLAAQGNLRAWLLSIAGEPAAYLVASIVGDGVRLDYFGEDPAFADLAPRALLLLDAVRDLFGEGRWRRVDFGAGARLFADIANGGLASVDVILLRPSLANRVAGALFGRYHRARQALAPLGRAIRLPSRRRG